MLHLVYHMKKIHYVGLSYVSLARAIFTCQFSINRYVCSL